MDAFPKFDTLQSSPALLIINMTITIMIIVIIANGQIVTCAAHYQQPKRLSALPLVCRPPYQYNTHQHYYGHQDNNTIVLIII